MASVRLHVKKAKKEKRPGIVTSAKQIRCDNGVEQMLHAHKLAVVFFIREHNTMHLRPWTDNSLTTSLKLIGKKSGRRHNWTQSELHRTREWRNQFCYLFYG